MSERNRQHLKQEFSDGERPSGADFADLMDSFLNKADDALSIDATGTLVLGQGMRLAVIGVVIGVAAALGVTRLMQSMLFNVGARDPLTFAVVGVGFLAVAIAASCLPARQAATVDPLMTLRAE